ncbi:MAG: Type 1 glutamine amidotransferase-like domain-containing protein [Phycisphaerales bacterium]
MLARFIGSSLLTLAVCTLGACTPARHGHLVVIGGGIKEDNAEVWKDFVAAAGPKPNFVVVPTASQDHPAGIANNSARIGKYAPNAPVSGLSDDNGPDAVASINTATALFFTGGDQSRITKRFRPDGKDTPERAAMFALLARDGVIAGTSAGAAMMSDPMFTGGASETALGGKPERRQRDPDDDTVVDENPGPRTAPGMGFFPYGMTDSHFFSRGRVGRLVAALEANKVRRGFGVADNRALGVDLSTGLLTAFGDNCALVVDAADLQRSGLSRKSVRITLLSDGDVYDTSTGRVTPGHGRTLTAVIIPERSPAYDAKIPDAWRRDGVIAALQQCADGDGTARAQSAAFDLRYRTDDRTRFGIGPGGKLLTAVDVILDITERPQAGSPGAPGQPGTPGTAGTPGQPGKPGAGATK